MTTPREPQHDRWDELAAGYALDALEPAEEAELLAHLDNCETCRAALRDHEFVAAQLGALADDDLVAPPAWSTIRAGVIEAGQPAPAAGDNLVELDQRRAARTGRPFVLVAAAAAAVVVAGVVTVVAVNRGPSATEAAISACQSQSACHVVELRRGSNERAVVIVRAGSARLLPTDLATPGGSRVYALWQLPRDGRPTLLAQPVPRTSASSSPLQLPYDETAAFALSVEPSGPRATVPTTVVAVGTATT